MNIEETLKERGAKYGGSFIDQAAIAQSLKEIAYKAPNRSRMMVDQREAIDMIMTKLSRILYGDPNEVDSWHDIQGYARLIEKRLEKANDVQAVQQVQKTA